MPETTKSSKPRARAKGNLSSFDVSQIEADLFAVEAENLKIDKDSAQEKSAKVSASGVSSSANFKPHPINVVDFNPDNSKLLHKVLRSQKQNTKQMPSKVTKVEEKPKTVPVFKSNPVQVKPILKRTAPLSGMDGFKRATQPIKPSLPDTTVDTKKNQSPKAPTVPEAIVRPSINTSAVALTGMSRANQFNRFALEQHKTSLQNQIEKNSLFARSLDGEVEILDKGLQTNDGKKVYNIKRRKSMLGGVDQHNLGPGKIRQAFRQRPVKFLAPIVAVLVIGIYVTYLNLPVINVKLAESKSGVAVSEPSYTPEGYKLSGPIEAETGKVEMSFKKDSNDSYNVSQKVSDWDSKALLENKILKETKEYSAYTDRGLTIYVYDGKATWVNQGKVYEIQLDGSKIDVEDMVRIAGSM